MRTALATVLGVLAVALITLSAVAVWARATVFDGQRFSTIVVASLDEEEVADELARTVTAQIVEVVDLERRLSDLVPGDGDGLAGAIAGATQGEVERRLADLLDDPRVQQVVQDLVERVHARVVELLEGDGLRDGWTVQDGAVTVNMLPLIGRGLELVQDLGLLDDVEIPEMTAAGDPDEQIAALSDALDRDLPDDFGQIVVYRSDRLAEAEASVREAQRLLALAGRTLGVALVGSVVAAVGCLVAARDRWAAVLRVGLGVVAALGLLRASIQLLLDTAPDLARTQGGRVAIATTLAEGTAGLLRLTAAVLIVAGAAVVVAVWRRGWRREDLLVVAVVAAALASVALVGLGTGGILTALLAGGALVVADRLLLPHGPSAPPA